jgi:glutamate/tyrosine decarboxylase-like PLP-dependent enzyme
MLKNLPSDGLSFDEIRRNLHEFSKYDMPDTRGRLFSYVYESGNRELDKIKEFYWEFVNKNALDFTVFPSVLKLENDVVAMTASLLNGTESTVGNFTSGGTESIMLAVKSARDYHRANKQSSGKPEMILPSTGHPAFIKAAAFFDVALTIIPVDKKTFKINPETVEKRINEDTALIVGSAPSYPTGVIDPIESLGKIARKNDVLLHVDACMGGFILPFFRMLGERLPEFDFSVKGVTSISSDLHKYGYAPKGASVILYRDKELRAHQLFTYVSWPGYPMANTTLQSTRSEGPLAASWATLNYLGIKGYTDLSKKVLDARNSLTKGLERLGYEILCKPEAGIVAFRRPDVNIFQVAEMMKSKGWFLQVQPGSEVLDNISSLHMTVTAAHENSIEPFLRSLEASTESARNSNTQAQGQGPDNLTISLDPEKMSSLIASISRSLNFPGEESGSQMLVINQLIRTLPPELVEKMFRMIVNAAFTPTSGEGEKRGI